MPSSIKNALAPIVSMIIFILGSGYFATYVPVRLSLENINSVVIGIIASCYYLGLLAGAFKIEMFISRVGHIRSFTAFVSLTAVFTMLQGFFFSPWLWAAMRFGGGFCTAALLVTIESWLLSSSTPDTRGKILSIYMAAFYAALGSGQFLLDLAAPRTLVPFAITVILCSIAAVPISISKLVAPPIPETSMLGVKRLFKLSSLAATGAFLSGMLLSGIYSLLPVFAQRKGFDPQRIALIMSAVIFGGFILQWPLGWLSDRMDRRKVILLSSLCVVALSLITLWGMRLEFYLFLALIVFFGGFSFALYPLCISHACDAVDPKEVVSASGSMLLSYAIGAVAGPLIAPLFMRWIQPAGLFVFFAFVSATLSLLCLYRIFKKEPIAQGEKLPYTNAPRTTPVAAELDPRTKEKE